MRGDPSAPAATSASEGVDVGTCLRGLRAKHGHSLRSLAERSGLAVNTLSLIENRRVSPSVSTLQQLAAALDEPITAFFEPVAEKHAVVHSVAGGRPRAQFAQGEMQELGAAFADPGLVPLLIHLEPSAESGEMPIVHTGTEFVYCLSGALEYVVANQPYPLSVGDSLLFEAHLAHSWRNVGSGPVQALLVLSPSDSRDRGTDQHLLPEAWPVDGAPPQGAPTG